jgi:hypothetical protein
LLKFLILLWIISIPIIGAFNIYHAHAEPDPEVVQYHLKFAEGMLKTCYTKDPISRSLIPNPALSVLSDLATSCEEKMQSLDDFLAEFVDDEDGELYAEHIANRSEPESSKEQALTVLP